MRRHLAIIALISISTGWLVSLSNQPALTQYAMGDTEQAFLGATELTSVLDGGDAREYGQGGLAVLSSLTDIPVEQQQFSLSLQDETGAIAQTPEQQHTVPYFANMAALAMLSAPDGYAAVKAYLEWYVAHLNAKDRFGLAGTIYDYKRLGTEWVSTNDYDSADSYAATFLSLVAAYTRGSGDFSFAEQYFEQLVTVANVLLQLQDKDGLIWAKPRYYVKFLMDNAENYRGLLDAADLMQRLGRSGLADIYRSAAARVARGIEQKLWSEKRQCYAWAMYGKWWARYPKHRWYPDTVAQVYPIVFGVVPWDSERAQALYAYLNDKYPHWVTGQFDDRYPWTILALVAATMQDQTRAVAYLDNVNRQVFEPGQGSKYPWYAGESAFLLQAWHFLRSSIPAWRAIDSQEQEQQETGDEVDIQELEEEGVPTEVSSSDGPPAEEAKPATGVDE
ncbi:MAG: hypothetical protein ACOX2K_00845 [Bacillota bacterium]